MSLRGQSKAAATVGALERLLVVASGPVNLALAARVVEGILPLEEAGAKDVATVRGVTYLVAPLAGRWGETPTPATPNTQLILCGNRGQHHGFTVDQVLGLTEVDPRQIRPLPPHFACEERTWFKGLFRFRDTVALLINPDWLLASDKDAGAGERVVDTAKLITEGPRPTGNVRQLEVVDAEGTE